MNLLSVKCMSQLTPFIKKMLEKLLIKCIWKCISPHIGMDQLGCRPGCSIVHYIIRTIDFILRHLDNSSKNPKAVIAATVDISKAFSRMSQNTIITILSYLNIPTCALKLIICALDILGLYPVIVLCQEVAPRILSSVNLAAAPCSVSATLPDSLSPPTACQALGKTIGLDRY